MLLLLTTNQRKGFFVFNYCELLSVFPPQREERLKKIKRYRVWGTFFYRSSVWNHTLRLAVMVRHVAPIAGSILFPFDKKKALAIALVHDDAEMVTGDVTVEERDCMTASQREELDRQELTAIEVLAREYPRKFMGYDYQRLLHSAARHDCLEAIVVHWLDKVEAYCEMMHDLLAGNILVLRGVVAYAHRLMVLKSTYPDMAILFQRGNSPLLHIDLRRERFDYNLSDYAHLNQPHTPMSIRKETDFLFYDLWKKLLIDELGEEGERWLTVQVEGVRETEEVNQPVLALVS